MSRNLSIFIGYGRNKTYGFSGGCGHSEGRLAKASLDSACTWLVLIRGPQRVDCTDLSPWDKVISTKLGDRVITLETRIYT